MEDNKRFRPYKDTPLSPNGRCLHGSQSTTERFVRDLAVFIPLEWDCRQAYCGLQVYTVDCMLYGELEHAHCHVQPEKMEEKPEKMEETEK